MSRVVMAEQVSWEKRQKNKKCMLIFLCEPFTIRALWQLFKEILLLI